MSTNITDEEMEAFVRLQESDPVEGVQAMRQLRAERDRVRAANLQKSFDEFRAENADVLDDPWLSKKAEEVEQQLLRNGAPVDDPTRWRRAVAIVRRKYGDADTRAIREMARVRSMGTRGMPNPNQLADDERDERITAEDMEDQEIASARHDQIAKIKIGNMGRPIDADPEFGRKQVQRQRAATVAERRQAERDALEG